MNVAFSRRQLRFPLDHEKQTVVGGCTNKLKAAQYFKLINLISLYAYWCPPLQQPSKTLLLLPPLLQGYVCYICILWLHYYHPYPTT